MACVIETAMPCALLLESDHEVCKLAGQFAAEKPNHRHRRLLRPRRDRPCRRTAEQRDELAAFHSRTSLARAMNTSDKETPTLVGIAFDTLSAIRLRKFV